ncbi:MAG: DinB family protein [Candidatus Thorarchaeota archaeon]|jgi:uncharacterized damage-inducible protein DinB
MGMKVFALDTLDIAEWNVLRAIMRLKPADLEYQITSNLNPIQWIIGHLTWQMDHVFNQLCQGKRRLEPEWDAFATGAEKMNPRNLPISQKALIDTFLEVSKASFEYLQSLPEEKFDELPENNMGGSTETVGELIQRVSLHFLGHTGQIYWIKKELGKGGYFVTGVKKKQREDSRRKWLKWWNENGENYISI